MRIFARPGTARAAVALGLVLVLGAMAWSLLRHGRDGTGPDAVAGPPPGTATAHGADRPHRRAGRAAPGTAGSAGSGEPVAAALGSAAPGEDPGGGDAGRRDAPGLRGHGGGRSLLGHPLVLRVYSEAPIGTIGYEIPTSVHRSHGVVEHVGRTWTLRTTVYGRPDYARVWVQAGATGVPVTCRVAVSGHITDRRTTAGPYGQQMCQG